MNDLQLVKKAFAEGYTKQANAATRWAERVGPTVVAKEMRKVQTPGARGRLSPQLMDEAQTHIRAAGGNKYMKGDGYGAAGLNKIFGGAEHGQYAPTTHTLPSDGALSGIIGSFGNATQAGIPAPRGNSKLDALHAELKDIQSKQTLLRGVGQDSPHLNARAASIAETLKRFKQMPSHA